MKYSKFTAQQRQLETAFKRETEEVTTKFSAQQRKLQAAFKRENSLLRQEFQHEASRLRNAMGMPAGASDGAEPVETQQISVAPAHTVRQLQGNDEGSSAVCSSTDQATAAFNTVQTVCCTQRGESCSSSHFPLSCDHGPECSLAVHAVARLCSPFLQTSILSATLVPLQRAATLCSATSPPDMVAVHTLSDAARGGTSVPNACFSTLRTQVDGQYRNGWNALAVLQAPLGFLLKLVWRAFDVDDFDFVEIYENRSAMQAHVWAQKLGGRQLPGPFTSLSNIMLVRFISNADGTSFGGSADITCALRPLR